VLSTGSCCSRDELAVATGVTTLASYEYDEEGRLSKVDRPAVGSYRFRYDDAHQLLSVTEGTDSVVTAFTYDDAYRARVSDIGAGQERFVFTYSGNQTSVRDGQGWTTSYGWSEIQGMRAVTQRSAPCETCEGGESYGYDALDRLTSVARSGSAGNQVFRYDRVGNRLVTQADAGVQGASYDLRNQLTSTSGSATVTFRGTLDEPGVVAVNGKPARMVSARVFEAEVSVAAGENTITVEAWDSTGNRKLETYSVTQPATAGSFVYDATGNLIQRVDGSDTWSYEWDAENQLKRVTKNGAEVARFQYDALGRRVEKVAGGIGYEYAYDGQDILKESRSDGAVYTYAHGPGIDEPEGRCSSTRTVSARSSRRPTAPATPSARANTTPGATRKRAQASPDSLSPAENGTLRPGSTTTEPDTTTPRSDGSSQRTRSASTGE